MTAHLHSFRSIAATYPRPQGELLTWLAQAHARAEAILHPESASPTPQPERYEKLLRRLSGFSTQETAAIQTRASFLSDFQKPDFDSGQVYALTRENRAQGKNIQERMKTYSDLVVPIFDHLYPFEASLPSHIVHVSCTGYVAPSPPQQLLSNRGYTRTSVTHAYHMGCYASLPAVRIAAALAQNTSEPLVGGVDVVHTELCSLHLDPSNHSPEQLVVQSLFADGAIAYRVSDRAEGFRVLRVHEELVPNSLEAMTWIPAPHGLTMTLAADVPARIAAQLRGFVERLLAGDYPGRSLQDFEFAIHPGGPKIIDGVKETLQLSENQVTLSRKVLRNYGNLSSATLPHIWKEMLDSPEVAIGKPIISLAFGPGLTLFGMLSQKATQGR